jgi:hypothetical protein
MQARQTIDIARKACLYFHDARGAYQWACALDVFNLVCWLIQLDLIVAGLES